MSTAKQNADRDAGRKKLDEFRAKKSHSANATAKAAQGAVPVPKTTKATDGDGVGKANDATPDATPEARVDDAHEQLASMKEKLKKAVKKGKQIELERDEALEKLKTLTTELGERATADGRDTAAMDALVAERDALEGKLREELLVKTKAVGELEREIARVMKEKADALAETESRAARDVEAASKASVAATEASASELERLRFEIEGTNASLRAANEAKENAEAEAETLRRSAAQTNSGAEARAEELSAELEIKASQLSSLEAELMALSSAAEEEKAALAAENVRLANKVDENRLVLEEVEKEKEVYVAECEQALQANEEQQRLANELKQRLHDAEALVESKVAELAALAGVAESQAVEQEKLRDAERRASEASTALAKVNSEMLTLRSQNESTTSELRAKVSDLQAALNAQRSAQPPAMSDESVQLRQQLDAANSRVHQLQNMLSDERAHNAASSSKAGNFTNKKNEDFADTDIEGAVLTGGSYAFVPLQGHLKSATNVPVLQHPVALNIATHFDRASVYLQRRPFMRLGLALYVLLMHLFMIF